MLVEYELTAGAMATGAGAATAMAGAEQGERGRDEVRQNDSSIARQS